MSSSINDFYKSSTEVSNSLYQPFQLADYSNKTSEGSTDGLIIWYPVVCLIAGLVGFLSNLVVSIVLSRQLKESYHTKRYSLSLALGHVIYCIAALCDVVSFITTLRGNIIGCKTIIFLDFFGYYLCTLSLMTIATERFSAIKFPIHYKRMTRLKNVRLHVAAIWSTSLILTIYPTVDYQVITTERNARKLDICSSSQPSILRVYSLVFDAVVPILVFTSLTLAVIVLLKKRSVVSVTGSIRNGYTGSRRSMKKPYICLSFIAAMFLLSFGSYFIYALMPFVAPWMRNSTADKLTGEIVYVITVLHTWFNPVMHWVSDPYFRDTLRGLVCRKSRQNQGHSQGTLFTIPA